MATETITTQMSAGFALDCARQALPVYLRGWESNALKGLGIKVKAVGAVTPTSVSASLSVRGEDVTAVFDFAAVPGGTRITGTYTVPAMNRIERLIVTKLLASQQSVIERDFSDFVRGQLEGGGAQLAS